MLFLEWIIIKMAVKYTWCNCILKPVKCTIFIYKAGKCCLHLLLSCTIPFWKAASWSCYVKIWQQIHSGFSHWIQQSFFTTLAPQWNPEQKNKAVRASTKPRSKDEKRGRKRCTPAEPLCVQCCTKPSKIRYMLKARDWSHTANEAVLVLETD